MAVLEKPLQSDIGQGTYMLGTDFTANQVNQAIASEVSKMQLGAGQFYKRQITVNGVKIEYTSYCVRDNVINIGLIIQFNKFGRN